MNVLVIGDTHYNTSAVCNVALPQAKKNDCKLIVQVGDFGFFPHIEAGRRFLAKVSKHLVRNDLVMYWIDGNHDNHPVLWRDYRPSTSEGLCEIGPNLFYIPRGTVFSLGHVKCLGLGGAFSIDKESRLRREKEEGRPGTEWWPTEMIRAEDAFFAKENARDKGPVDIMFTHECPFGIDIPGHHSHDKWRWPQSVICRELLRDVFDSVQPRLLIHGHHHERYTDRLPLRPNEAKLAGGVLEWDYCRVDCLANDGLPGFAVVLDLDSLFVQDW